MDNVHGAWRLTGFYGYLERRRSVSWDLLQSLAMDPNTTWCCIGDFNDVLCQMTKKVILTIEHPQWLFCGTGSYGLQFA